MTFLGKYSFKSTNAGGTLKYLGPRRLNSELTLPQVNALSAGNREHWIAYQITPGELILQTGAPLLESEGVRYLQGYDRLGLVRTTLDREQAGRFRFKIGANGLVQLEIQGGPGITPAEAAPWYPVSYVVDTILSQLTYPIPGRQLQPTSGLLANFERATITPGLTDLRSRRNARGMDFTYVDLTGADLSGLDCSEANFNHAILDGVDFSKANLSGATFLGASLNGILFSGVNLNRADLSGTDLTKVKWGKGITARQARFVGCTGVGCQIGSVDVNAKPDFTGADLTGADFGGSDFSSVILESAILLKTVFVGATFNQNNFRMAQLGGLKQSAAALFSYAFLTNVDFTQANLFGVSFAFASLFGASTQIKEAATIEQADFTNAYLEGIDLGGATLRGAKFSNACLVNVNFSQADLTPTLAGSIVASLTGACLQGATCTGTRLDGADLTNATIATQDGSLPVRYCDPGMGGPFPPPPDFEPLNYSATRALDLTTMSPTTVCPNGNTVRANQTLGIDLAEMLRVANPAAQWVPMSCYSAASDRPTRLADFTRGKDLKAMDAVEVMQTPGGCLRVFGPRSLGDLGRMTEDPDARTYLFNGRTFDRPGLKALFHYYRVCYQRDGISLFPGYRKSDGAFVGVFGLFPADNTPGPEVVAAVLPEFRGDPLVKELYLAVLDYGFGRLLKPLLYATIAPENIAANRFAEKIGYRSGPNGVWTLKFEWINR